MDSQRRWGPTQTWLAQGRLSHHPTTTIPGWQLYSLCNCSFGNGAVKPPEEKLLIIKGYLEV